MAKKRFQAVDTKHRSKKKSAVSNANWRDGIPMSAYCDEELVARAFHMALVRRHPEAGLLHHSDRGCQYTSRAYRQKREQAWMVVSMSRKGNCWIMPQWNRSLVLLKRSVWGSTIYSSHEQARLSLFEYLRFTTIARGVIQRSDMSVRSSMSSLESKE